MLYCLYINIQIIKQKALPILKKHGVIRAGIFGSAIRGEMTEKSDVDLLVELPKDVHGFDYVALKVDLEEDLRNSLGTEVDIVEYNLIKADLRPYILPTQVQIL